jgi:retinol dehydrogenase-12
MFLQGLLLYPPVYGAYTELFAGLSPDVLEWNGAYIIPWGRIAQLDSKFQLAVKSKDKDGTGIASQFYDWCSEETASYMT